MILPLQIRHSHTTPHEHCPRSRITSRAPASHPPLTDVGPSTKDLVKSRIYSCLQKVDFNFSGNHRISITTFFFSPDSLFLVRPNYSPSWDLQHCRENYTFMPINGAVIYDLHLKWELNSAWQTFSMFQLFCAPTGCKDSSSLRVDTQHSPTCSAEK